MATSLLTFQPVRIRACATSGNRKPYPNRRKTSSHSTSGWWAPLFGWSSEPEDIDSSAKTDQENSDRSSESISNQKLSRSRFAPGCFTKEKAKQLRLMTMESGSFHDAMYHSAIASRLASDFKNSSDL